MSYYALKIFFAASKQETGITTVIVMEKMTVIHME